MARLPMRLPGFADRVDMPALARRVEMETPPTPPRPAAARRLSEDDKTRFASLPDELLVVFSVVPDACVRGAERMISNHEAIMKRRRVRRETLRVR